MESLEDQIKRYAEEFSRYDALRNEALRNLQRLAAQEPNGNGGGSGATHERKLAAISRIGNHSSKGPRSGSKAYTVLEMLKRPGGVSAEEIASVMQWELHTTRSFLSTAPKKFGVEIVSVKNGPGKRLYAIK